MSLDELKKELKDLISSTHLAQAIEKLVENLNSNSEKCNDIGLLRARHIGYLKAKDRGTTAPNDLLIELNRITEAVLNLISNIEKNDLLQDSTPSTYFLGIGIEVYKSLPKCENAVDNVVETMKSLLNLKLKTPILLFNEQATKGAIENSFSEMIEKVKHPDTLIVHYSGFCRSENHNRDFWLPYDAVDNDFESFLDSNTINDNFVKISASEKIVFVTGLYWEDRINTSSVKKEFIFLQHIPLAYLTDGSTQLYKGSNPVIGQKFQEILAHADNMKQVVPDIEEEVKVEILAHADNMKQVVPGIEEEVKVNAISVEPKKEIETTTDRPAPFKVTCPEEVFIPGGDYITQNNIESLPDFYIGKYPIRNFEYVEFVNEHKNSNKIPDLIDLKQPNCGISYNEEKKVFEVKDGFKDYPVVYISWAGALEYAQWLSQKTSLHYYIPTSLEWEYAANGGSSNINHDYNVYAGSDDIDKVAWYSENSNKTIQVVGQKKPNQLGIYDMCGNVWEWCQIKSNQQSNYYPKKKIKSGKATKGGSWKSTVEECLIIYEKTEYQIFKRQDLGFRIARSLKTDGLD